MPHKANLAARLALLHNFLDHLWDVVDGKLMVTEVPVTIFILVSVKRDVPSGVSGAAIVSKPNIEASLEESHRDRMHLWVRNIKPRGRIGERAMLKKQGTLITLARHFVTLFIAYDSEHCKQIAVIGLNLMSLPGIV